MKTEKHLKRRVAALEQSVAKLIEDIAALQPHKTTTSAEEAKHKNVTPKIKVSLRDIIFNWEVVRFIISVMRAIIEVLIED